MFNKFKWCSLVGERSRQEVWLCCYVLLEAISMEQCEVHFYVKNITVSCLTIFIMVSSRVTMMQ